MVLLGDRGFKLLRKYGIPVAPYKIVKSTSELTYPIVLKAISEKLMHKTEAGAVKICYSKKTAREFFEKFRNCQIIAQKLVHGYEVAFGIKKDPTFGHVLMFGLGGVAIEIYRDVVFRVCPVRRSDVRAMIREVKGHPLLAGARGPKANLRLLENVGLALCKLAVEQNIRELDVNPFIIGEKDGFAVDVRIL